MNLSEVLVVPDKVENDSISLRYFTDDNISPEMAELIDAL
jgi:hypothetical protein